MKAAEGSKRTFLVCIIFIMFSHVITHRVRCTALLQGSSRSLTRRLSAGGRPRFRCDTASLHQGWLQRHHTSGSQCTSYSDPLRGPTSSRRWISASTDASSTLPSKAVAGDTAEASAVPTTALYERLQWLSQEIIRNDELYYDKQPVLSDDDYDALVQAEADICRQHPDVMTKWQTESGLGVAATRYGGRVGSTASKSSFQKSKSSSVTVDRVKRKHVRPMLSLDNVNTVAELLAWLERVRKKLDPAQQVTVVTEPKLDGLSLSLHYVRQDGNNDEYTLEWASTRGDGKQGQDVTAAVKEGMQLPSTLALKKSVANDLDKPPPAILEIRGEVVMPQTVFESIVATSENVTFSNARNAASGILLRKEQVESDTSIAQELASTELLRSKLRFYAYDVVATAADGALWDGLRSRECLQALGFLVPEPIATTTLTVNNETAWDESNVKAMLDYHESLRLHREDSGDKSKLEWGDYDMDGCVHKISEQSLRTTLGTSNRAPRWAIAHKFPPLSAITTLLDIDVQVGRTGALTPVAILEPVDLRGVTVQRATLHNFIHMRQVLGDVDRLPRGSQVMVRRAGDVIPQVVQRVGLTDDDSKNDDTVYISLDPPTACPSCGSQVLADLEIDTSSSKESNETGQVLRCAGPQLQCPARAIGAVSHAFSRDALDMTGLSEARIQQLMDANLLRMPSDVFALAKDPERLQAIAELDGWGPKSAENLARVATRVATNGVNLSRFIYSLSIRYAGVHSSALVASAYGSVDAFLQALDDASAAIDGGDDDGESFALLREETDATKGIGPVLLASLDSFAQQKDLVAAARALADSILVLDDESRALAEALALDDGAEPSDSKPLLGMSVVFTGSLTDVSRSDAKKIAKRMGAKSTPGSISKTTSLVVAGSKSGKKLEQAENLGVRVIDGDEFNVMVELFKEATGL